MKKILKISLLLIIILCLFNLINNDNISKIVFKENDSNNHYKLVFDKEPLTFRTIKLKLSTFVSNGYITKIYIKYNENIKDYFKGKEYFSFDNSNINTGIESLKKEYMDILDKNYLYSELDKNINDVVIQSVDVYVSDDVISRFKNKYPNVKVESITNDY